MEPRKAVDLYSFNVIDLCMKKLEMRKNDRIKFVVTNLFAYEMYFINSAFARLLSTIGRLEFEVDWQSIEAIQNNNNCDCQ